MTIPISYVLLTQLCILALIEMLVLTPVAHMKQVVWVKKVITKLRNFGTMIFFGSVFASPLCGGVSMHISPILAT